MEFWCRLHRFSRYVLKVFPDPRVWSCCINNAGSMEVPWSFDVDYTDLSRYVLKALCPYLVVLLYERCRFHGGSMEFPWRFNADSNGISKILLFLLANVNDQKIWMEHHLTTFWFFTGSVFWITRIFLGTFWRPSQFPCVNTINDAGSMEVA